MYRLALLCLASALTAGSALANEYGMPPAPGLWSLSAGVDIDEEGGYIAGGSVAFLPNEKAFFSLSLATAETSTDVAGVADVSSDSASALADYNFGPVGASVSAGWYADDEISDRIRYGGSIYTKVEGFRFELSAEKWDSDFETFQFDGVIERQPPMPPLAVSSTADCEIENTTLGARASYQGEHIGVYASFRDYDYSDPECSFGIFVGGVNVANVDVLTDAAADFFRRIAIGTLGATRLRLVTSDNAFLDQSFTVGASLRHDKLVYGIDYYHSEEIFAKLQSDTLSGRLLFPIGNAFDMEVRLGVSDGDQLDTTVFVGATVFWYLASGT